MNRSAGPDPFLDPGQLRRISSISEKQVTVPWKERQSRLDLPKRVKRHQEWAIPGA